MSQVERADEDRLIDADARAHARSRFIGEIPRFYVGVLHLLASTGICVGTAAYAVSRVNAAQWFEWLVVPAMFALSNLAEWRAHARLLHRYGQGIFRPLRILYHRHTRTHHACFVYDQMEANTSREWALILLPPYGILVIVLAAVPASLLVGLASPNAGWLMLATGAGYVGLYEWMHLLYHLPRQSFFGRMRWVRSLAELHSRHHHPRLMQRWNFNVTIPLFDWMLGTLASDDAVDAAVKADREPRH